MNAFSKYAQNALDNIHSVRTITRYALMINLKANQLLMRAALNKMIDLPILQKKIFESGRDFIQKFAVKLKENVPRKNDKNNDEHET